MQKQCNSSISKKLIIAWRTDYKCDCGGSYIFLKKIEFLRKPNLLHKCSECENEKKLETKFPKLNWTEHDRITQSIEHL